MTYFSKYFLDYNNLDQQMINKEFISACTRGNTEQMEYLCFSNELPIKAQYEKASVILSALRVSILLEKQDSLNFLINTLNISKTFEVEQLLEQHKSPIALSMFLNRDTSIKKTTHKNKFKI